MKPLKLYVLLFSSLSCICGMCSKDDTDADNTDTTNNSNNNSDNYKEPDFNSNSTWIYMRGEQLATSYGPNNNRPQSRKWIATKVNTAISVKSTIDTNKRYLSFAFENTDKYTRFLTDKLNPGGKEVLSIFIDKFNPAPGTGTYTTSINVWYDVYNANGVKIDSTKQLSGFKTPVFTIIKMTFVSTGGANRMYKMSGTADFQTMYFKPADPNTGYMYDLSCTFNNVPVLFLN